MGYGVAASSRVSARTILLLVNKTRPVLLHRFKFNLCLLLGYPWRHKWTALMQLQRHRQWEESSSVSSSSFCCIDVFELFPFNSCTFQIDRGSFLHILFLPILSHHSPQFHIALVQLQDHIALVQLQRFDWAQAWLLSASWHYFFVFLFSASSTLPPSCCNQHASSEKVSARQKSRLWSWWGSKCTAPAGCDEIQRCLCFLPVPPAHRTHTRHIVHIHTHTHIPPIWQLAQILKPVYKIVRNWLIR